MTVKAYLLSLPERLIRSTVGLGAGVAIKRYVAVYLDEEIVDHA